jgi:hypothetical protein
MAYNHFCKEQIQARVETLEGVAYTVKALWTYETGDFYLASTRALIAKVVGIFFYTNEPTEITFNRFETYFLQSGWQITEYPDQNSGLRVSNGDYIISVDYGRNKPAHTTYKYKWVIYIYFNDIYQRLAI